MLNKVLLQGKVLAPPVTKQIKPGSMHCEFEIVTDRRWSSAGKGGKTEYDADVVPVVAWNKPWVPQAVREGDLVYVEGRIQMHNNRLEVVAEFVENVKMYQQPPYRRAPRSTREPGGSGGHGAETDAHGNDIRQPVAPPIKTF